MKQVVEDPNGVNYATNYTYSTTGNLIRVEQGTQYRYFLYDSLSRLLRARNPEQNTNSNLALTPPSDQTTGNTAWALKYVYDSNGNLTGKVDPRNVTTNYGYDALNRNIWTSYSDSLTPTLERHYDAASNGKGRLYYTVNYNLHPLTNAAAYSYTQVNGYDAMGRVTGQTQNFLNTGGTWTGYTTSRTYDLAGHPLVQTYPSNRTVTNAYGDSGRLTSNTGTLGNGTSRNYATGITYTAAGLMSRETFGMQAATLYHNLHYNNRQQLVDIRVGDSSTDEWNWTRGALVYYYGTTARDGWNAFANSTDNNGNVLRQINYVPLSGGGNVIPQLDDYNYDALNRITSVSESQQNSSGSWTFNLFTQNFGYDRWGNRTVSCSPCQSGVTGDTFTVDTATNRLTAKNGIGLTYDSAGNQTYDATGNRWFDGENRMHKATQGSVTSHYVYDADGKRVRRIIGSAETWMVYGLDGELVAEYSANGASGNPQKEYGYRGGQMLIVAQTSPLEIRWTVPDHLGTPRMNIRGTGTDGGSLASATRHDYLPFGEELFAGVGIRSSSSHGYEPPSDGVRQKFTGYERDDETGLDFAQERYYSSKQGRFISVDPLMASAKTGDPQTWNRFVYVLNNPLRYTDPDGMQAKSAWSLLTKEEQQIISSKLVKQKGEADENAFVRIIGSGTAKEIADKVTLIKNFIDSAGGHGNSDVWKQVASISGVWLGSDPDTKRNDPRFHEGGGLAITVNDKDKFLEVLSKNGYAVDVVYDWFNKAHPNNSAREITETSWETGMHLANDDSSNLNKFFVHWDKRSTEFKKSIFPGTVGRIAEQRDAGKSHFEPFTASEIRQQLRQRGIVPRNEP